jgi:glutathione S-transferase
VGNNTELIAEEVRSKNPMDQIPLLEYTNPHTGESQSLTQSLAIIEFLEESYPAAHKVLPTCTTKRARARQVSFEPTFLCMCVATFPHMPDVVLAFLFLNIP